MILFIFTISSCGENNNPDVSAVCAKQAELNTSIMDDSSKVYSILQKGDIYIRFSLENGRIIILPDYHLSEGDLLPAFVVYPWYINWWNFYIKQFKEPYGSVSDGILFTLILFIILVIATSFPYWLVNSTFLEERKANGRVIAKYKNGDIVDNKNMIVSEEQGEADESGERDYYEVEVNILNEDKNCYFDVSKKEFEKITLQQFVSVEYMRKRVNKNIEVLDFKI